MKRFLAVDIGASSGRHIVGWRDGSEIKTDEVYRFENGVSSVGARLTWDIAALYDNVVKGIKAALEKYPDTVSLAIDTWGVDYVLMDGDNEILPCISYRDERTVRVVNGVHSLVPFDVLYARTGIQFQSFNTVYQLFDDMKSGRLERASDFLMIPEYLTYKLTGVKAHEYTNATTTGLVNGVTGEYDRDIIKKLGLPQRLFFDLSAPGARVGKLKPEVAATVGGNVEVMLCASHDTASAVEGIPMDGNEPYISSGTWSLLGVKVPHAKCDVSSRAANYSNEGGVGYVRYQKNIMGMWVVNRLRAELCPNKPWDEITAAARASDYKETVDINADAFLSPASMTAAFDGACKVKPKKIEDYFNCAYLSLAQSYKKAICELEQNTERKYSKLYIVGGGAKNKYLNELTEHICGIKVIALPIEATAIGNIKLQLKSAFIT